ncbi:MAG TPA: glutamate 5-kinase [Aquiluna sp.]
MSNVSALANSKRIVLKVGSSSITNGNEKNLQLIADFAKRMQQAGKELVVVSSGAIATAAPLLGLTIKSDDLPTSQALASIGQAMLMGRYERALSPHGIIPGQILLTVDNLEQSHTAQNALLALERLLEVGVLPIINENDSVATSEIRFGDNDQLAAKVAKLLGADLLILLSDVDSLYTKPPGEPGAERLAVVPADFDLESIQVSGTSTGYGTGGAVTKLVAARLATMAGIGVLLTESSNIATLDAKEITHTWFEPAV